MNSAPVNVSELAQVGAAALQRGDAPAARAAFDKIIAAGVADVQVWFAAAIARRACGDLPAAQGALDEVLKIQPHHLRAMLMKADCYQDAGDGRAASAYYTRFIQIAPDPAGQPPEVAAEIRRARSASEALAKEMLAHLTRELAGAGYDPATASKRFNDSLAMLAGVKQRYIEEPKNFFFSGLLPSEFYAREEFPWLEEFERATGEIAGELAAALAEPEPFEPYVRLEADRPERTHKLLDKLDWGALYLIRNGELDQRNAARFPKTLAALSKAPLDEIEGRGPMALFSRLTPGTRIDPHTGFLNSRLICHLPIITPGKCYLRVGNETREWERGKTLIFNDTVEHEAWNDSGEDRVVLLFSIWRPELSADERRHAAAVIRAAVTYSSAG